uniref:Uncharacterized protein n=1 Tax=Parascaris equorum TaxID=6256 RepID=A0A914RFA8_PAREQ
MTPISAIPLQEPPKNDEKSEAEMQLKAKTKRLLEMQLRFTRKATFVADESVAKDGSINSVPDRALSTERCSNQHQCGRDEVGDLISIESSRMKQVLESSPDESVVTRDTSVRGERDATKNMENDLADASRKDPGVEEAMCGQDSSRKIVHTADAEIVKSPAGNADSARDVDSSFSKPRSRKGDSNKENEV